MAHTEKNTRIKFIPPRIQSSIKNASSGSGYPTIFRTSVDNRTGNYNLFFDDSKSVDFISGTSVAFPSGLPSGSYFLFSEITSSFSGVFSNVIPANVESFLFVSKSEAGQKLEPFKDCENPAIEEGCFDNSFYLTGSRTEDIGEGFSSPLFDKTKITIDLGITTECSACIKSGTVADPIQDDYPMVYYNHTTKTYVGVGYGASADGLFGPDPTFRFLSEKAYGFGPSGEINGFPWFFYDELKSLGSPISNFGFPNHEKFITAATGSFLYPLSGVLSEPFMVEKVVLEFSGALSSSDYALDNMAISTFFILNKKRPDFVSQSFITPETDNLVSQSVVYNVHSSGSLDLVTYLQISAWNNTVGAFPHSASALSRELNIETAGDFVVTNPIWGGWFTVSGTVKSAEKTNGLTVAVFYSGTDGAGTNFNQYMLSYPFGGRNGLYRPCGRNWLQQMGTSEINTELAISAYYTQYCTNTPSRYNPYILFPTDELVFGWQVPMPFLYADTIFLVSGSEGPSLKFPVAPGRVTLYGSLLRDNKEHHDTLNQLLNTDNVLETIG